MLIHRALTGVGEGLQMAALLAQGSRALQVGTARCCKDMRG
jgi:hypothetical protein